MSEMQTPRTDAAQENVQYIEARRAVYVVPVKLARILERENTALRQSITSHEATEKQLREENATLRQQLEQVTRDRDEAVRNHSIQYGVAIEALAHIHALREALESLVFQLEYVHSIDSYKSVWALWQNHHGPYKGPFYVDELNAAKRLLSSTTFKPVIELEKVKPLVDALKWNAGPAEGGENLWTDCDELLIAVPLASGKWDFAVVVINVCDGVAEMALPESGDSYDAWGLESISYWIHTKDIPKQFAALTTTRQWFEKPEGGKG